MMIQMMKNWQRYIYIHPAWCKILHAQWSMYTHTWTLFVPSIPTHLYCVEFACYIICMFENAIVHVCKCIYNVLYRILLIN